MMNKRITLFLILVASVGTMLAWDYEHVQIGDLYYNLEIESKTAEVTYRSMGSEGNYTKTSANIPATVIYNDMTYSVTSIGEFAFLYCHDLASILIPNSVTSIGEAAFGYCSVLSSIEIPNSVKSIGDGGFNYCTSLTSFVIPNSVTNIGNEAFYGCTGLTSIVIPKSVTNIGIEVFAACTGLTSIEVEKENIVYDSRDNCNAIIETTSNTLIAGFKHTVIPNSVTSIGAGAFAYWEDLTSVTIPNSVTSIGIEAFYGCNGLTIITCEAIAPPSLGEAVFFIVDKSIPLYVPYESIYAYQTANQWKDFKNIRAIVETEDVNCNIRYIDKNSTSISNEQLTFHVPEAPVFAGFTFLRWEFVGGAMSEGLTIQAVYQANEQTSAPEVYTNPKNPAQKLIKNGNVYILTEDKTYTITGQEVK